MLLEETPLAYIWRPIAWLPKTLDNVESQYRTVLSKLVRSPGLLLIKKTNCPKSSLQMKGLDRSHSDRLNTNDLIHQTVQMVDISQCLLQRIHERLKGGHRDPVVAHTTENRATHHFVAPAWTLVLHDEPSQHCRAWRHSLRARIFQVALVRICLRAHDAGREMILPEYVARFTEPFKDSHQPHTPRQDSRNRRKIQFCPEANLKHPTPDPMHTLLPKWMQIFARYRPIAEARENVLEVELSNRHQTRRIFICCLVGSNELGRLQSKDLPRYS